MMVEKIEADDKTLVEAKRRLRHFVNPSKFFNLLFEEKDWISIRFIETWIENEKKRSRVNFQDSFGRSLRLFSPYHLSMLNRKTPRNFENIFFACAPRLGKEGFEESWQIRTIPFLWADVDDCSADHAQERCEIAGLPDPSIINDSGNGAHLYWLLESLYLIDDVGDPPQIQTVKWIEIDKRRKPIKCYIDAEDGETVYLTDPETGRPIPHAKPTLSPKAVHVQDILAGIAAQIGGDHTHDLARLLRVPGTMNRKDQRNGQEPKLCEIVEMEDRRYSFADFEKFAKKSPVAQEREKIKAVALPTPPRKLAVKKQDKLNNLITVCSVTPKGSRSEADFSLCCYAIRNGVPAEKLWPMVQGVGRFAESGEGYFHRTYNKAADCVRLEKYERAIRKANPAASSVNGQLSDHHSSAQHSANPSEPEDDRPEIEVTPDEHIVNEEAVAALSRSQDIYQRGGKLVRIVQGDGKEDGIHRPSDSPRISLVQEAYLRDRLSANAKFFVKIETEDGPEKKFIPPTVPCVKAVHAYEYWPGMRRLDGISEVPILRLDGTIVLEPGYDLQTRIVYLPTGSVPAIPDQPSRADALAVRDLLLDLVSDFPFSKPTHKSAWLASLLSVVGRPAYSGPTPLFLLDANVRGSGKSLLTDVVAEITTGRAMSRMSNPKDDDECRKRITALALNGDSLILLDNISSTLGSAALDVALTSTVWKDRLLGNSQMVEMPFTAVWFATGNNVILGADTTRRVCHIRLESPEEKPEERDGFKHADLLAHVRTERMKYLTAALTILRAYFVANRPKAPMTPWGSFEGWSDLIRQSIVWVGLPDPAETRQELVSRADTEADALRGLIAGWEEIDPAGDGLTANQALGKLDAISYRFDMLRSAICTLCDAPGAGLPSAKSLGIRLQQIRGRVVGGKALDCRERNHTKVWYVRSTSSKPATESENNDVEP